MTTKARFARWFWRPPRRHGEVEPDRQVSSLELLYDLVYVALISQASHRLIEDVSARRILEFAIVFGLILVAWMNGSLYLEIHGREDGRTRSFTFVQMGILALLAAFTGHAPDSTDAARPFIAVYNVFIAVSFWLWYSVRRRDTAEWLPTTGLYLQGMAAVIVAMAVSAFVPDDVRLAIWAGSALIWLVIIQIVGRATTGGLAEAMAPTDSLVERFGLFTIIVLGEVVFGVVEGLSQSSLDPLTIATGMLALGVGFGLWWIYFDVVGARMPRTDGPAIAQWVTAHFPLYFAIAAGGAAMVSVIEHAGDPKSSPTTAWLLAGAVALELLAVAWIIRTLADRERLAAVYRPMSMALLAGAVACLALGWLTPAPWLLVTGIGAILSVLWFFAAAKFLRADAWGPRPE